MLEYRIKTFLGCNSLCKFNFKHMPGRIKAFEITIQKTNAILDDIENELNWAGQRNETYAVLRVVLHALRDRLPVNDVVKLGAQLLTLLRGVLYEGWDPHAVPHKMDKDEFLQRIKDKFSPSFEYRPESVARAVMNALRLHIDPNEIEKLENVLPRNFGEIME